MLQDLKQAGQQLRDAWDHYQRLCSDINAYTWQGKTYYDIPRGLVQQIDDEIAALYKYEENSRFTRHTLKTARRRASRLAPINALPSEILTRIFRIALTEPCGMNSNATQDDAIKLSPGKPDNIAQVCTRWHNIATSCPYLWTHLDLPLVQSSRRLASHAKYYSQRAGNLSLEIHIHDMKTENSNYDRLIPFLETAAKRMKALEFTFDHRTYMPFHLSIIKAILSNCSPGVFTKFITCSPLSTMPPLPSAENRRLHSDSDSDSISGPGIRPYIDWCGYRVLEDESPKLMMTKSQIESIFAGLTVLRLSGCYPSWDSTAYHGLVDLRLTQHPGADRSGPYFSQSELIAILKASPGLKVLHLRLKIPDESSRTQTSPVPLTDLEVLNLSTSSHTRGPLFYVEDIVRLIAPGPNPLRLTLDVAERAYRPWEMSDFFERSNVERFCLRGAHWVSDEIFRYTPNIKHLVLQDCEFSFRPPIPQYNDSAQDTRVALPCIDSCYVETADLCMTELGVLVELCPGGIVLSNCYVFEDDSPDDPYEGVLDVFPTVKFIESSPYDPTIDWDTIE